MPKECSGKQPQGVEWVLHKLQTIPTNDTPRLYTDGSYATRYRTPQDVMHICPSVRQASGSVVIMDASDEWRNKPVLSLRITDQDIEADSAYDMEFIALAAVLGLLKQRCPRKGYAQTVILPDKLSLTNTRDYVKVTVAIET